MPPGRGALTGAAPLSPLQGVRPGSAGRPAGLNSAGPSSRSMSILHLIQSTRLVSAVLFQAMSVMPVDSSLEH